MKKIIALFVLLLITFSYGCQDNPKKKNFTFTEEYILLGLSDIVELPIELESASINDIDISFSTEGIVTLDGIYIIPVKTGYTVLTASLKNNPSIKQTLEIQVNRIVPKFNIEKNYLEMGKSMRIDIDLNPKDFDWSVDKPEILSLSNTNVSFGVKPGFATVTIVMISDPEITASISIEVLPVTPNLVVPNALIQVGDQVQLMITNLDGQTLNDFTWDLDKSDIITIDDSYLATAIKEGVVTLTVTSKSNDKVTTTFELTVSKPAEKTSPTAEPSIGPLFLKAGNPSATVKAGETIEVKIAGGLDNYKYRWRSSDASILAATDQGKIMGIREGQVTLEVISKADKNIRGKITITVVGTPNVDYISRIIEIGIGEKGYLAGYKQSNKYGDWFEYNNVDWCAIFVAWCTNQAGIGIDVIHKYSLVSDGVGWFKDRNLYQKQGEYTPKAGDIIFFQRNGTPSHTGIVTDSDATTVYTVEGNTSNGVFERQYSLTDTYVMGYGTPQYPTFTK